MTEPTAVMGRRILGRYRLGAIIGRGGAATVYRAVDERTGEEVAVKEIPLDGEMAHRAGAEVRAAGRLTHPAIVELIDFGEDDHACYLISELVIGNSLSAHRKAGTLSDAHYLSIMADILEGLDHAHATGVVHRDVKPANILVDRDGRGRLTDFGIARILGEVGLTMTGAIIGTVSYMAPEQARGSEADPQSDIYSACIVLYEGLVGRNPQAGANPAESLVRVAHHEVPRIADARPDLPRDLCDAIDAGLDPDPRRRPDPRMLAAIFRAHAHGRPAPRAARVEPTRRPAPVDPRMERPEPVSPTPASAPDYPSETAPPAIAWAARAVPAILFAIAVGVGIARWSDQPTSLVALGAAAAGAVFLVAPWLAGLAAAIVGCGLLAREAPAFALLVSASALVLIAPVRGRGRLLALPAIGPVAAGLGITPVMAFAAGLVRGWAWRTWAAISTFLGILVWQITVGADPSIDGGPLGGIWPELTEERSPLAVVTSFADAVAEAPSVVTSAAIMAAGVFFVPGLMRFRRGIPRTVGIVLWIALLVVAVRVTGGSAENAIGAFLPGGILVAVGAALPLERLRRGPDRRGTATLRANRGERLPAS